MNRVVRLLPLAIAAALLAAAFSAARAVGAASPLVGVPGAPKSTSAGAAHGKWVDDQSGTIALQRPDKWTLHPVADDGRIRLTGPDGDTLVVWPFVVRDRLATAGASALLQRVAGLLDPGVRWRSTEKLGLTVLRCLGRSDTEAAVAGMTWREDAGMSAGFFYGVTGPEGVIRQNNALYTDIIKTLRIHGAPPDNAAAVADAPGLRYRRWQDPVERAFTIEVPEHWGVSGGLVRRAAVDVTKGVQITSPDGQIRLNLGDAAIPSFTTPNQTLAWTGFHEGSWYSPGYGVNMMVMRYKPGVQFAGEYVENTLGRHLQGFRMTTSRALPDATAAINAIYRKHSLPGFQLEMQAGEVRFAGEAGGQRQEGYCFASTQYVGTADGGVWQVEHLFGYIAPEERAAQAEAALAHLAASFTLNPEWVRMQQGLTGNVSAIVTETGNAISNIISSTHASRQRSQDDLSRRYSNAIRGTEDVRDPETGREYKVESGSNYYWIDPGGTIIGTDLQANPDAGRFQQMMRLP